MFYKEELLSMLLEKSFKYTTEPSFLLNCGIMSNFYVNCRPAALNPRGMFLIGHLVFDVISDIKNLAGVGGMTFGADPIAMATAYTSELKNHPIKAFSIRKEQKNHGIIRWIEGDMKPEDKVVILEDVVTTGDSTIKAIKRAQLEGLDVARVVVLVDRQEMDGLEKIKDHLPIPDAKVIFTKDDLIDKYLC